MIMAIDLVNGNNGMQTVLFDFKAYILSSTLCFLSLEIDEWADLC